MLTTSVMMKAVVVKSSLESMVSVVEANDCCAIVVRSVIFRTLMDKVGILSSGQRQIVLGTKW